MQWRPVRRFSAKRSPPRRPLNEMQRMPPRVQILCRRDCRKTPVPSLACFVISLHCQLFTAKAQFLTRIDPVSMVRAVLGGGTVVILPEPSRVSKAWPTTHAKKVLANDSRLTRLRSPRGLSVSANGSAASMLTVLPKVTRVNVRPPIRRRSPAVFGSRPSSWPGLWLVRPSAGCLIAGSEFRLGE